MGLRINSVLCATDFSDFSNNAVYFGMALAREFKARLYVCHVIDLPTAAMYGEALLDPQEIQTRIEDYANEQLAPFLAGENLDWHILITIGRPAEEISRLARENAVDLAVAATHGRSGLQRLILGSVTERLMHTLPCPLLVVHDEDLAPDKKVRFERVAIGCDFSPDSALAVQYGLHLAQNFQSELHLLHVLEPSALKDLIKSSPGQGEEAQGALREQVNNDLAALIPEEAKLWCQPKTALLGGQPYEELNKYAVINDISLIVLGVHGRGFVEKVLVGSTTDRVIRTAPCPVLSVRPLTERC
ncbi:MAG: universal stress protein [Thermodesulfobacteriota bacterium]